MLVVNYSTAAMHLGISGKLVWIYKLFSCNTHTNYPLSYGVPVRERYGSTLLPTTREQHDQNCTQSH